MLGMVGGMAGEALGGPAGAMVGKMIAEAIPDKIAGPAKLATSGQWRSHGHGVLFLSLVLLALLLAAFIYQIVTTP